MAGIFEWFVSAPSFALDLALFALPAAIALLIYAALGGTRPGLGLWVRFGYRAHAKQQALDEAEEHEAACRREQAIFDAVLAEDRKRRPPPWRKRPHPTI